MADKRTRVCLPNLFSEQPIVEVPDPPITPPMTHKIGSCCFCQGGEIYLRHPNGGDFLTIRYQGNIVHAPMPAEVLIPKCTSCGEVFLGYTRAQEIAQLMNGELP